MVNGILLFKIKGKVNVAVPFDGLLVADEDFRGAEREALLPKEDFFGGGKEKGFVDGVVGEGVG